VVTTARTTLDRVNPDGTEELRGELELRNLSTEPVSLPAVSLMFAARGGYADAFEPPNDLGAIFGNGFTLPPGGSSRRTFRYTLALPASHVLLRFEPKGPAVRSKAIAMPVPRSGFSAPASLDAEDVYLGVMEPLEILTLSDGERWLMLTAQIVSVDALPVTVSHVRIALRDDRGTVLERDETTRLAARGPSQRLRYVIDGFAVPPTFRAGTLEVSADIAVAGQPRTLRRTAHVSEARPVLLTSPVRGLCRWLSGPGTSPAQHVHARTISDRYAYDLNVLDDEREPVHGDRTKNESFVGWRWPIHAAAAGTVLLAHDTEPDNFGNVLNPANKGLHNNKIVIAHADGTYTFYVHIRQGSARVKVGQAVLGGDTIAELGNAGVSNGPHLHFSAYRIDDTGRLQAVATRFSDVTSLRGQRVREMPRGGLDTHCGS
jgi:hypothetical protein